MRTAGKYLLLSSLALLTGCSEPVPVQVGRDTYSISTRQFSGGPAAARNDALHRAALFCEAKNQRMVTARIQSNQCAVKEICGEAQMYFYCVSPNDPGQGR